jgi:hypothetical protein
VKSKSYRFNHMKPCRSAVLSTALLLVGLQAAVAQTIEMKIFSGASSLTIGDNAAGDANPALGQITFIGSVGAWNLNVDTGTGSSLLSPGTLDLSYNAISMVGAGAADPLTIEFSQSGTFPSFPSWALLINGNWSNGGGAVAYSAYESNGNAFFATDNQIGSTLNFSTTAYSGSGGGAVAAIVPYSLTQVLTIVGNGTLHEQTSGDAALMSVVPEPTSLLLLGFGLAALAPLIRRKSK